MAIRYFLLIYDRQRGELVAKPREFVSSVEASEAYGELEEEYREDHNIEVVLVGADSLETVKKTHSNYFKGGLSEYLAGV